MIWQYNFENVLFYVYPSVKDRYSVFWKGKHQLPVSVEIS